ncbi:MAG: glutamylcysteine synthetase [Oscillospiraceae bacterium]|nr:glutamylcysteine synthetase [Oscillospiraceae bacterium]
MDREAVKERLYEKYIAPIRKKRKKYIGIEIEMPVVNLSGAPTDYGAAQAAAAAFRRHFGFVPQSFDDNGVCYCAVEPETGDALSFDCSYNNMELSLGRGESLGQLWERFSRYVSFLNGALGKTGHILTGMGVNPGRAVNRRDYLPAERYRMLEHYLQKSGAWETPSRRFHAYPDFGAFTSASQVQLDVSYDRLLPSLRAFSLVEPVKAVLFSNSLLPGEPELLCVRDMLWADSTHGINPHNVGMLDWLPDSVDDLLEYLCTTSLFCALREGRYCSFRPLPVADYLGREKVTGEYYAAPGWAEMDFRPEPEDLAFLRTYKFEDLTFRGTIEFRSVCCQPFSQAMTVAAFHMGLMERPEELAALLESDRALYHHGYSAPELRALMNRKDWPGFVSREALRRLCLDVLKLAQEGLKGLSRGDERFLTPLFHRAETLTSPGRYMAQQLEQGTSMRELVLEYARLS